MAILSTTLCYPTPPHPGAGSFVQKRLGEVHKHVPVHVVAPIPICPPLRNRPDIPAGDVSQSPPVVWPSMFYFPGVLKNLDAYFYAECLDGAIEKDDVLRACRMVDAHFVWPDGVGAWQVARRRGLPFVCTIRGKLVSQTRFPKRRRMIAEMLRDADRLVAVSQSLADLACDVTGRALDVAVIPNGVDTSLFRRQPGDEASRAALESVTGLDWPASRRHVVAVGHLQRLKGFHRLIEAWPDVLQRCPDARLILVGGAAGEPAYERELCSAAGRVNASAGNTQHPPIVFAGRQPPETIAAMLNAAGCFAIASESEGWCNAIAEALACGCPVVATDVGGNREQLGNDGTLGRLVTLNDRKALAAAIADILSGPPDRDAIALRGSRRSWQQVAAECVDVYQTLLR